MPLLLIIDDKYSALYENSYSITNSQRLYPQAGVSFSQYEQANLLPMGRNKTLQINL